MPGSKTTQGHRHSLYCAYRVAFRHANSVGTLLFKAFAAQWLACRLPCQRFVSHLTVPHA